MQNKPYKIIMSRGDDIEIDVDEVMDVLEAIHRKQPAMVRKGVVNPSFYVSIIEDKKRWDKFLHDIHLRDDKKELLAKGVPKLKPIFNDTVLKLSVKN